MYISKKDIINYCRAEARKYGLTFKVNPYLNINNSASYIYCKRYTGEVIRTHLTLSLAYEITLSGELAHY